MVVTGTLQKILMRMSYESCRYVTCHGMVCSYAAAASSELSYYTSWQLQEFQVLIKHKSLIELESQEGFDLSLWSFQPFIFLKYLRTD